MSQEQEKVLKEYSVEEVSKHNSQKDGWIIVDNLVFDVSKFMTMHPGGLDVLLPWLGKDSTEVFYSLHRSDVVLKYKKSLVIGTVNNGKSFYDPEHDIRVVPYSEPGYLLGLHSPYYTDSHKQMQIFLRKWIYENLKSEAEACEDNGKPPSKETYKKMGQVGLLLAKTGPGKHLSLLCKTLNITLPGGVDPKNFDYFHEYVAHYETSSLMCPGYIDGITAGYNIGLPVISVFATDALKMKVIPECVLGEKKICLAISEPFAGSDVGAIKTVAIKSKCGNFYTMSGTKKWITNGTFCDYFVTAARTGPGPKDISLFMVERSKGLQTKIIKTSYSTAAGTAYIMYDNVEVPASNLLGKENEGFQCIMFNFNHERWMINIMTQAGCRKIIEECFKWAKLRKVFGKPLLNQPVIREKLAHMCAQLESVSCWLEDITYQMCKMSWAESQKKLGGPIALNKMQSTKVAALVSNEACQIFGGRAITRSGMGKYVERMQRSYKYATIYGGSEEIMADLGVKMAMKWMPKDAKL